MAETETQRLIRDMRLDLVGRDHHASDVRISREVGGAWTPAMVGAIRRGDKDPSLRSLRAAVRAWNENNTCKMKVVIDGK